MNTIPQFTTYANMKAWLNLQSDTDQAMVTRLINDASRMILAYIQRPSLYKNTYNDVYDGVGSVTQYLNQWPVLAISSVVNDGVTITAMPAPQTASGYGYILSQGYSSPPGQPQSLTLRGGRFCDGKQNIAVSYTAGYSVANEAQTVPAVTAYTIAVNAPLGMWAQDDGVTYANGTAMTAVTGIPTVGQYAAPTTTAGLYTFAAADANAGVLISYSYIPYDIEQACIELTAERYKYRVRIGEQSHGVGGQETTAFNLDGITDIVKNKLMPYRRKLLF